MKKLLLAAGLILTTVAIYSFSLGKGDDCPPEGKANPAKGKHAELKPREQNLNKHKNRQSIPQKTDYDNSVSIQKMYDSKDDSLWSEDKAATITGYFFRAVDDGAQSCNCYTEDKTKYSIKIYISPTPIQPQTRTADCIVAVLTPYSRSLHTDWNVDKINSTMGGQIITVSGWLIYDYVTGPVSIETNSNSVKPERRTIWGLCPATDVVIQKQ